MTTSLNTATSRPAPDLKDDSGFPAAGIRAVCFDIDDTLIIYSATSRATLADATGTAIDDAAWVAWQTITDTHVQRVIAGQLDYADLHNLRTHRFLGFLGVDVDLDAATEVEQRRRTLLNQRWSLYDDAVPCLTALREAGYRIGAITNASGTHQHTKIIQVGLARFFDYVAVAGEVGATKPDPVIFHKACAALGVAPEHTLHIGDRVDLDAAGARDAGLAGVWLDRDSDGGGAVAGTWRVTGLGQLTQMLGVDG